MSQSPSIDTLKKLLFEEEFDQYKRLHQKVKLLESTLDSSIKYRKFSDKEVNELLIEMMKVMPDKLGPTITRTLKAQIKNSRDDVVHALFPIVGQMIKKYLSQEIQLLSERIDRQFEEIFSIASIKLRIKALFTGVSYSELVLKSLAKPEVKEVFLIDNQSGILLGSYSQDDGFDKDMVAAMLTAIKAFVQDAFNAGDQGLETISFDTYTIYVQDLTKYYVAVVVAGNMDQSFKSELSDKVFSFAQAIDKVEGPTSPTTQKKLKQYFQNTNES